MRDKFPIIKNRDRWDYRLDTHKWIDLARSDYLSDNDEFSMFFLDRCNCLRLAHSIAQEKTNNDIIAEDCRWKVLKELIFLFFQILLDGHFLKCLLMIKWCNYKGPNINGTEGSARAYSKLILLLMEQDH